MPKSKATNRGTCQWCGRIQKLPNGAISLHGYTVQHGFFNGECRGSFWEPYELSCDLIQESVDRATEYKAGLEAQIVELSKLATEPKAWYDEYVGRKFKGDTGYQWRLIELYIKPEDEGKDYPWIWYTNHKGQPERMNLSGIDAPLLSAANKLNTYRIRFLQKSIAELDEYIARQTKRIKEWELKPLLPLQ